MTDQPRRSPVVRMRRILSQIGALYVEGAERQGRLWGLLTDDDTRRARPIR